MEKLISSNIVYQCPIFKVEEAVVELPNGKNEKRWYVIKENAVGIIAVDPSDKILLTREYRSAAGEIRWRIPAGGVKEKELPEEAARRELREETSFDCNSLKLISAMKSSSGIIKQTSYFFLAKDLFINPLNSGEWEQIEVVPKTVDEVVELINKGELQGTIAKALLKTIEVIRNDLAKQ